MASYVAQLRTALPDEALAIKRLAAAGGGPPAPVDAPAARAPGVSPGSERWPVKTGADNDRATVGKVIVDTTVREMGAFPRPPELLPDTDPHRELDSKRIGPVETTVWRVNAHVIALKMESDGDYHLVLQDDSGAMMIAEIPLPDPQFVDRISPFFDDIAKARQAADKQFGTTVGATAFAPGADGKLVPAQALQGSALVPPDASQTITFDMAATTTQPQVAQVFATRITPTLATLTGIGFSIGRMEQPALPQTSSNCIPSWPSPSARNVARSAFHL